MEAASIGVANGIEPVHGALFGVVGGSEKAIDEMFVGLRRPVILKGLDFGGSGNEAGEVQRNATDEGAAIGFRRRGEAGLGEVGSDEKVDGVGVGGRIGTDDGPVSPVALIDGAFGYPAADDILLLIGEVFVSVLRRHALRGGGGEDALDDGATIGFTGNDGDGAIFEGLESFGTEVEAEIGDSGTFVGAVAAEAGIGHDGPDVAIEFHRGGLGREGDGEEKERGQGSEAAHDIYVMPVRGGVCGFVDARREHAVACDWVAGCGVRGRLDENWPSMSLILWGPLRRNGRS
jgi:hypothetical protein